MAIPFSRCVAEVLIVRSTSMNFTRHGLLVAFAVVTFPASILAYGPLGHQIVGAIADERLTNTPDSRKGLRVARWAKIGKGRPDCRRD